MRNETRNDPRYASATGEVGRPGVAARLHPAEGEGATAILASGLVKTFGATRALDGLDLTVNRGEIHGFLGPNGAGKTTTIRALLGLYRLTDGEVRVFGMDPGHQAEAINQRLAYVPGDVSLWGALTGAQVLDVLGGLRGRRDLAREQLLTERFQLDPTKRVRAYSKGNRQKVALVAAFAAPVDLLVLDEPTSGIDPLMEETFAECVTEAADRGQTVLLSSHILSEVERLCQRVTIIKDGRTVETGTLAEMRHLSASTITVRASADLAQRLGAELTRLGHKASIVKLPSGDSSLTVSVERRAVPDVLETLGRAGAGDVTCAPPSLEDLFLRHYAGARG